MQNQQISNESNSQEENRQLNQHNGIEISADQLLGKYIEEYPKLIDPIFPKVGIAFIAGEHGIGKTTMMIQLGISIIAKNVFLDFPINNDNAEVLYICDNEDMYSIRNILKWQKVKYYHESETLTQIRFIFDMSNPLEVIDKSLEKRPVDVVIIDSFSDIYLEGLNQPNRINEFLKDFKELSNKHECLIIFTHYVKEGAEKVQPNRNNLLGSRGIIPCTDLIIEMREDQKDYNHIHFCIVKANYLLPEHKDKSYVLEFDETTLLFRNTKNRIPFNDLINKPGTRVKKLHGKEEEIIQFVKKGFTRKQLCEHFDVSRKGLWGYCKEHGIEIPRSGREQQKKDNQNNVSD